MKEEISSAIIQLNNHFNTIDSIALHNEKKVLDSFIKNKVSLRHFNGTSGYGYDDCGRDTLANVFADVFGTEKAIVSPNIASGTHAITLALFGVLRPNDRVLCITGQPYDTLQSVIYKSNVGSLADFGVQFDCISMIEGQFDKQSIKEYVAKHVPKMIYLQRSRGYEWRNALSISQIEDICSFIKKLDNGICIFCDNCYGEFVEKAEPTNVGVDVCAGSLIKNIGGGIAPTGGYVVGRGKYVDLVAGRLTVPEIGCEIGSYLYGYRELYQGLFMAPHVVGQALKTALLFARVLQNKGYEVLPKLDDSATIGDIVCSVKLGSEQKVVDFCKAIQSASPVDGYVSPEPWDMPGYENKVIMAAGCFVQGASIELSCDGPIKPPYIVYLQGGLTFEHGILALEKVLDSLKD